MPLSASSSKSSVFSYLGLGSGLPKWRGSTLKSVQRRTAEQIAGMRFAVQHQVPVVPEAEKCRDDDEANKTKIEAKSAEEYRDENESNKAMNETTIAEKCWDVDEANKKKIEVESIGDYRDEDEANRVMIETRNGSENYCVTARNTFS